MEELSNYYKRKLCFFYYCIENKIISNEEIREWADYEINSKDELPLFIYDISLAKNMEEQFQIIDNVMFVNKINKNDFFCISDVINQIKQLFINNKIGVSLAIDLLSDSQHYISNKEEVEDIHVLFYHSEHYYDKKDRINLLQKELIDFFNKYTTHENNTNYNGNNVIL